MQCCRCVEAGKESRLPLGAGTIQYVAHPLAHAAGRRGETWSVDGPDDPVVLAHLVDCPDLRPFEHLFGE
jgi:hypothetical protein